MVVVVVVVMFDKLTIAVVSGVVVPLLLRLLASFRGRRFGG